MDIYKWHEGEQWSVEQNTDMLYQNALSLPTKQSSVVRTYGYTANSGASAKQALREAYFRAEAVDQGAKLLLCKREHLGVNSQSLQKQQSPAVPRV